MKLVIYQVLKKIISNTKVFIDRCWHFMKVYRVAVLRSVFSWLSIEPNRLIIWLICLFISVYYASFFGIKFFPGLDIFGSDAGIELYSVTISALSALLGIILAFLIATFEMNKRYLSSNYGESLFRKDALRTLIVLFFSAIFYSVGGLLLLTASQSTFASNLGIVTIYIFVICLLFLLPKIRDLISDTGTKKEVLRIIDKYVGQAGKGHYQLNNRASEEIEEIAKKASTEGDEGLLIDILEDLNKRFYELAETIEDGSEGSIMHGAQTRDLSSGFSGIFYTIGKKCLDNNQLHIASYVSESIGGILNTFVDKKQLYYTVSEAEVLYVKLIKLVIKNGNEDLSSRLIYGLESYIENQLKNNTPPSSELWDFKDFNKSNTSDTRYDLSNHWNHISRDTFRLLQEVVEFSIKHSNGESMKLGLSSIQNLSQSIIEMSDLSHEHKRKALRFSHWVLRDTYSSALKSDLITLDDNFTIFMLSPYFEISKIIQSEPEYSVWNLQEVCNIYYSAVISKKISPYTLNNIGATGRTLKHMVNKSNTAYQAIIYIVYVLGKMKSIVEPNIHSDIWSAEIYLECHDQATSIRNWDSKKTKNRSLLIKLNRMLKEYTQLELAKSVSESDKINFWKELFPKDE